jgi:chaperonin GroEL
MAKMIQYKEKALESISKGVETLARAVIVTLGPKGRNVVIGSDYGSPLSTKDGVTVAKEIELKDKFENMGAQLVKEASTKTADIAGDGTTTAIVLANAIFHEGTKNVIAGSNPTSVKRGIDKAVGKVCEELDKLATQIKTPEEITQIATISANNDKEIGAIIGQAMQKVGNDGIVTIAEAKGIETTLEIVEGMQFDKGFLSPYFITNPDKMTAELENCAVLVTDKKINSVKDSVSILEKLSEQGSRPILIIAEDIDGEALATMVVNKINGRLPLCAVKAPAFGDRKKAILHDIAALTGATLISDELGMSFEDFELSHLGMVKTAKIGKEETTLLEGKGKQEEIESRINQIRAEMKNASDYEKEKLEERLAKLKGGVAVIHVGAATESEMKEKKARVEDALHATKAAVSEGIVPGGGVALIRASSALDSLKLKGDEAIGAAMIQKAACAPAAAIANNCGKQGDVIVEKIKETKGATGYNGITDSFSDLIKDGVIDPVLVTKSALRHAASVASLLFTISALMTDKPEPKKDTQPPMGGGMPGMGGMGGMPGMGMM